MAEKTFNTRIVHKHDVESNWNSINFTPKQGELIVYDPDDNYNYERLKIGDGTTPVASLPFVNDDVRSLISVLIGDVPVSEQISTALTDVLYKTPQELTKEEVEQVRQNIHSAGVMTSGLTMTPFNVIAVNDYDDWEVEYLEPVVAAQGAEIYGDYVYNVATGMWSRASGAGTQALGDFSDASGWLTKASGYCSHAEGLGTIAKGISQHVSGEYNIEDTNSLVIVGNGSSDTSRSNAYRLSNDGTGYYKGDLYTNNSEKVATEDYVQNLYKNLASDRVLRFYCIEDVTIVVNGVSTAYPANSNVEIKFIETDVFEIIPTSDNSILALNAFPGALGTYYSWLEGVKQFSNILFDMNAEEFYSKWSQGNQGSYKVQYAQYLNCIFWSDNPYVSDVTKRTNYTLYYTSQLPLCYSNIPDNTFKAFYLAFNVNSDPNWGNKAYRDSFAKATWATQAFSYYGARTIGIFGHDDPDFNIVLPKDCRGLMFDAAAIENAGTFDAINTTNFGAKSGSWREAFGRCPSLRNLYIKNLKINLNISWSPINYDSISYIISAAANTNKITISVSPYTYNLLGDSDFELAASKNITIELITTNYVEDRRLSAITSKANRSEVLLKSEQTLTDEEIRQVRKNLNLITEEDYIIFDGGTSEIFI